MKDYLSALRHGFSGLLKFSGRDDSVTFWSYAATIVFLGMIAMTAGTIPSMMESMTKMHEFAMENPDQATVRQGPGSYSVTIEGNHPELMPDIDGMIGFIALTSAIIVVLLAASVCRRLHDTGLKGYWGLLPLPFLIIGTSMMPDVFENFGSGEEPDLSNFFLLFFNNLLYLASLGLLLFLLLRKSVPDPTDQDKMENSQDTRPKVARRISDK